MFKIKKQKKVVADTRVTLSQAHADKVASLLGDRSAWIAYYLRVYDLLIEYYLPPPPAKVVFGSYASLPTLRNLHTEWTKRLSAGTVSSVQVAAVDGCACGGTEMTETGGVSVCLQCGAETGLLSSDAGGRDVFRDKHNFNYRRINHFTEIMNQIQAKETTDISAELMSQILLELKKMRITNMALITREQIRGILKKIGKDSYYDHVHYIMVHLSGRNPNPLSSTDIERLNERFNEAQSYWFVHRPDHRRNFIGYNYVVYKLFELLELDEFKQYCPLLKTRDKLVEYDHVWRNICRDLRWEFYPTV